MHGDVAAHIERSTVHQGGGGIAVWCCRQQTVSSEGGRVAELLPKGVVVRRRCYEIHIRLYHHHTMQHTTQRG